jgi:hypothetical protein
MEIFSVENSTRADFSEGIKRDTTEDNDLFSLLFRIIFMSDEERFRAGIYIGYEGQKWINQAALVLHAVVEEEISL